MAEEQQENSQESNSEQASLGKTYTIVYDRENCIGAGACVTANSTNWEMGEDNKANCKKAEISEEELEQNMDAAKVCPVNVIHIEDSEGNKLI